MQQEELIKNLDIPQLEEYITKAKKMLNILEENKEYNTLLEVIKSYEVDKNISPVEEAVINLKEDSSKKKLLDNICSYNKDLSQLFLKKLFNFDQYKNDVYYLINKTISNKRYDLAEMLLNWYRVLYSQTHEHEEKGLIALFNSIKTLEYNNNREIYHEQNRWVAYYNLENLYQQRFDISKLVYNITLIVNM